MSLDLDAMKVTFLAAFPPIQSAIKITGAGDGMRIQLDVPESEMGNAIELLAWRQRVLKVTVELEDGYTEKPREIHI